MKKKNIYIIFGLLIGQVFSHKMHTWSFSHIKIYFFPDFHIVHKLINQSQCLCQTVCLYNNIGSTMAFKLIICISQYCLTNETQIELYKLSQQQHPKINPETTLLWGQESFPVYPSFVGEGVPKTSSSFFFLKRIMRIRCFDIFFVHFPSSQCLNFLIILFFLHFAHTFMWRVLTQKSYIFVLFI